jgi:hypothetical protein
MAIRDFHPPPGALLALVVVSFLTGCGPDSAPVSSAGPGAAKAAHEDVSYSLDEATHVETSTGESGEEQTVSRHILPRKGGRLYIADLNGEGERDNLYAVFSVPKGGVERPVTISMTVRGHTLKSLEILFAPGGLAFLKPAVLVLGVGWDLVDVHPEELAVYHQYADGTLEETQITSLRAIGHDNFLEIRAEIQGFSRYSIGTGY